MTLDELVLLKGILEREYEAQCAYVKYLKDEAIKLENKLDNEDDKEACKAELESHKDAMSSAMQRLNITSSLLDKIIHTEFSLG